ncbi:S8 family serine peptidase [Kordia sp. SMS9]|uniref:S8 family serine peptidase n=1 Tax=Kordia sp. SMS9 TaxID=2282170 RepID=UPI0013B45CDB|nr:S8 family serine peptidase [Kordia sp. SMS9]
MFNKKISKNDLKNWQYGDIHEDSIAGISLIKAYDSLMDKKKSNTIIIAVIDNPVDIEHQYLKNAIWINEKEIPNNNIDDDKNGFVDDVHGWNFLGNSSGENQIFSKMESSRILQKYESVFEGKQYKDIVDKSNYRIYKSAKADYNKMREKSLKEKDYFTMMHNSYNDAEKVLSKYFSSIDYSLEQLDSLKLQHPKDTILESAVLRMSNFKEYFGKDYIYRNYLIYNNHIEKLLNKDFNDRGITGDDSDDITDTSYGNNDISHNLEVLNHGTLVSGVLVKSKDILDEVEGITENAKIMPLSISCYGDEHDKDIALAIRYAVDNGAKVINMSFGKKFSLHKEWVFEAFKYAEKNDVLIISSAGNGGQDLSVENNYYPNDNENNGTEVSNNFLLVGASTYNVNEKLVSSFSNYGNVDVDIFAPGYYIYTTAVSNKYEFQNGTSMAASITSGVAALIRSYYPNLTAAEVKQIIMESGVSYDIMVNKPSTSKEKELVLFSSLSKSGKIVNAYNALLMAEEVSKKKKRN